jgi:hypothetical protein
VGGERWGKIEGESKPSAPHHIYEQNRTKCQPNKYDTQLNMPSVHDSTKSEIGTQIHIHTNPFKLNQILNTYKSKQK